MISSCGYFEKVKSTETKSAEKTEAGSGEVEFEVVEHTDVPAADSEEVQSSLPPEVTPEPEPVPTVQSTMVETDTHAQQVVSVQGSHDCKTIDEFGFI